MRIPAALLAAAVTTSLVACGGGPDATPGGDASSPTTATIPETSQPREEATAETPTATTPSAVRNTFQITVRGGTVEGGAQRLDVPLGEAVTLTVTSDVTDTVHVHGYDIEQQVGAGDTVPVTFTANIPGVFEVELEETGLKIAELEVGG